MTLNIDADLLAAQVAEDLQFGVTASYRFSDEAIILRIAGLDRPNGMSIRCWSGLALAFANIEIDKLAGPLLSAISETSPEDLTTFITTRELLRKLGIIIETTPDLVGEVALTSLRQIGFTMTAKATLSSEPLNDARRLATAIGALLLTLLPIDDDLEPMAVAASNFGIEGERSRRFVNHYERSRKNRALAISIHGCTCVACGFNFGDKYGLFASGMVEIHHLTPVHLMEQPEEVNPETDLVPLCSNCHSVAHKTDPPVTPEGIAQLIADNELNR